MLRTVDVLSNGFVGAEVARIFAIRFDAADVGSDVDIVNIEFEHGILKIWMVLW